MGDLISREEALEHIYTRLYESALNNVGYKCEAQTVFEDIAENRINIWVNEVPSIQPKTGHWKDGDGTRWKCSNCGYGVLDWNNTPYCPNCGAKMEKEDKE